MSAIVQVYAQTGAVTISTANPNIDGSGSMASVLTATNSGTKVVSVMIKAQSSTQQGMVRLFVNNQSNIWLLKEIPVPAIEQSAVTKTFEITVDLNINLVSGYELLAATEKANTFNIVAIGNSWYQCGCGGYSNQDYKQIANTGVCAIAEANPYLDGSGVMSVLLESSVESLNGGTQINAVCVKATETTTEGMVRLFIRNTSDETFLIKEICIAGCLQTAVQPAFRSLCFLNMFLEPGFKVLASTERNENFNVITFATDVANYSC